MYYCISIRINKIMYENKLKFEFQNLDLPPSANGMTHCDELEDTMMPKNMFNNRIFNMSSH